MTQAQEIAIAELFADIRRHDAFVLKGMNQGPDPFTPRYAVVEVATVESEMAYLLARENPEFDRERFLARCADTRSRLTPTEW